MISQLSRYFRAELNAQLQQRGYALRWLPPALLHRSDRLIEANFPLLAAHLMLTVPQPYFIGIGANDGVTHDPIYPFIRDFGWRGVMVEPIPEAFAALQRNYADIDGVSLVQAAIGAADGEGKIYSVEMTETNSMMMSLHSSFDREILLRGKRWHPDMAKHVVERTVPVMSFRTLLARAGRHAVDVLKIDTEGFDLEILKTVDFSIFTPRLILAEHANLSRAGKIEMAQLLMDQDYKVAMTSLDMLGYKPAVPEGRRRSAQDDAKAVNPVSV